MFSKTTMLSSMWDGSIRNVRNVDMMDMDFFKKCLLLLQVFCLLVPTLEKKKKRKKDIEIFRSLKCHKMNIKKSLAPRGSQRRCLTYCKTGVIKYLNPFRVSGFQLSHADRCQNIRQLC